MKIASWNVNGIRSVYSKGLMQWLNDESPDIVCIQEIKSSLNDIPAELKSLKGYHAFWYPAERKGMQGTAVLSRLEPMQKRFGIGMQRCDSQGRVITLEFKDFVLIAAYFPHGGRDKSELPYKLEMYKKFLSYLDTVKKPIILAGDFNIAHEEIDLARPKDNRNNIMFTPEERKQIDKLVSKGFVDSFRQLHKEPGGYTWWPYLKGLRERNVGWRLDYIFLSSPIANRLKSASIYSNVKGSDHCPIEIELL